MPCMFPARISQGLHVREDVEQSPGHCGVLVRGQALSREGAVVYSLKHEEAWKLALPTR